MKAKLIMKLLKRTMKLTAKVLKVIKTHRQKNYMTEYKRGDVLPASRT